MGGGSVNIKEEAAGGTFCQILHRLVGQAAFLGDQIHQLVVVKRDLQALGHLLAHHPAAGAVFPVNTNHIGYHNVSSFLMKIL